jgi:hypothetical protein
VSGVLLRPGRAATRLGSISCVNKARALGWKIANDCYLVETALLSNDETIVHYVIKEGCGLNGRETKTLVEQGRTGCLTLLLDRGQRLEIGSVQALGRKQEYSVLREVMERRACSP